jgi:hypothetical protein
MKKNIIPVLLILLAARADFTEIDPKGKNLLGTVADLDQLFNNYYAFRSARAINASVLVNDVYPVFVYLPDVIDSPVKTLDAILLTWDEEADRALLTVSDRFYEMCYSIIGSIANPVLLMIDNATGDRALADRLKAEALVLRAHFHYLAVNLHAKAYDPATAAEDGGVPYVKEGALLSVPREKHTVQQVYDYILADLQAARELDALPDRPANPTRVSKAFAHAVEARARVSIRDFPGAATAAAAALAIQNTVEDHRDNLAPGFDIFGTPGDYFNRPEMQSPEDIFFATYDYLLFDTPTPELIATFDPGSIFLQTVANLGPDEGEMIYGLPGVSVLFAETVYFNATGLSTVDMYLIQAECKLRAGDVTAAMEILNNIWQKRNDPYTPLLATTTAEAFAALKRVARTENWYGPKHFIDLKRWNTEPAYATTLRKTLLGVTYSLPPDSPLWIFPFPQNATAYNPNLTQNY